MSRKSLQESLDELHAGETVKLDPPGNEFKGPLVIRKPVVIEGRGGTIWAVTGPVLQVESGGVLLRDLAIEITSRDTALSGEDACALKVRAGLSVELDNVAVRGTVVGLAQQEGEWHFPRVLALGRLQPATAHDFRLEVVTPVSCTLATDIDGLQVRPHELPGGPGVVSLRLDAVPAGTRLRGTLLIRTRQILRRIEVNGQVADGGTVGTGQVLWRPKGDAGAREVPAATSSPVAAAPSPAVTPGTEILVVSPFDPADHRTIGEALARARTGARVVVRPGIYRESLTIGRRVEIVGDGPVDEIVVEAPEGNALLMKGEMARVRGLTLRAVDRSGRPGYAVHVPAGQLILEECHVGSESLACLAASGAGANLLLRRCQVRGGASAGVLVLDRGQALLEDCELRDHAGAGAEARRGGAVTLRRCRIASCAEAGVLVHEQGQAVLEACDVHGHAGAGAECREGGDLTLRRCKVRQCQGAGVYAHGDGKTALEDCELAENGLANLEARLGGNPILRRCRLRGGKQAGALFGRDAQGLLEDCELEGNTRAAVEIRGSGNPTLRRCTARRCGDVGVMVHDRGRGTFEDCDLAEAAWAVLVVRRGAAPVLRRCKIHDGLKAGALLAARGGGLLEECEVFANAGPGVVIGDDANPMLKGCQIRDNGQAGVAVGEKGRGTLEQCAISGNGLAGLVIGAGAAPQVRGCRIEHNRDAGVWARRGAAGSVEGCDLTDNREGALDLESGARLQLRDNRTGP